MFFKNSKYRCLNGFKRRSLAEQVSFTNRAHAAYILMISCRGFNKYLRVNVSKNRPNGGHGQKIDFAHTLSVVRVR